MTQRTHHRPEPSFLVCRLCSTIFAAAQPSPFCDTQCAADWAHVMVPGHLDMIVCELPPDRSVDRSTHKALAALAVLQEVWP